MQPGALFTNAIRNVPSETTVDGGALTSTGDITIDTDSLRVLNGGYIFITTDGVTGPIENSEERLQSSGIVTQKLNPQSILMRLIINQKNSLPRPHS